jgi:hypothetical protein
MEADFESPIKQKVGDEPLQPNFTAVVWMKVKVDYNHPSQTLPKGKKAKANREDFPSQITCTWEYVDTPKAKKRKKGQKVVLDVPAPK